MGLATTLRIPTGIWGLPCSYRKLPTWLLEAFLIHSDSMSIKVYHLRGGAGITCLQCCSQVLPQGCVLSGWARLILMKQMTFCDTRNRGHKVKVAQEDTSPSQKDGS